MENTITIKGESITYDKYAFPKVGDKIVCINEENFNYGIIIENTVSDFELLDNVNWKLVVNELKDIRKILERKKLDVDCTESESSEIKGFIKGCINNPTLHNQPFQILDEIEKWFPIEWSEVYNEIVDAPKIEVTTDKEEEEIKKIANSIQDQIHVCIARSREIDNKGIDYESMVTVLLIREIAKLQYEINLLKNK